MNIENNVNQSLQNLKNLVKKADTSLSNFEENKKAILKQRVENIDKNLSQFDSDLENMEKTIKLLDSQLDNVSKTKLDARRYVYSALAEKIKIY